MSKTASVTKLRNNLPKYIDELPEEGALIVIRRSETAAYLLSPAAYEAILSRLEGFEDIRDMIAALQDRKKGDEGVDAEKLFEELNI